MANTTQPRKGRPTKAGKVEVLLRETKVLELRAKGWTWEAIAIETGYSDRSAAKNAFDNAIKRTMQPVADEVRTLELERLDRFLSYLWDKIEQGDPIAIDKGLKIMDRRAKYLGLDAPIKQQVEVTTFEGGTELDREVQRLASLLADSTGSRKQSPMDSPASQTDTA